MAAILDFAKTMCNVSILAICCYIMLVYIIVIRTIGHTTCFNKSDFFLKIGVTSFT